MRTEPGPGEDIMHAGRRPRADHQDPGPLQRRSKRRRARLRICDPLPELEGSADPLKRNVEQKTTISCIYITYRFIMNKGTFRFLHKSTVNLTVSRHLDMKSSVG